MVLENQGSWRVFFSNPYCWWDNRFNKVCPGLPDFVQKLTKEVLRFDPWHDPPWVAAQLSLLDEPVQGSYTRPISLNADIRIKKIENGIYGTLRAVKTFCEEGQLDKAIHSLDHLVQGEYRVSSNIFYRVLQECIEKGNLGIAKDLSRLIARAGFEADVFLGSHLIRLFTLFGSLKEAQTVFNKLSKPNVYAWTAIITAHGRLGHCGQGFDLYNRMLESSVKPDAHAFVTTLQLCINSTDPMLGRIIHGHILEMGPVSNVVNNSLIDLYVKCGDLCDAQRIFNHMLIRDVFSWSTLIAGYAFHGHTEVAMYLFYQMQHEGVAPNTITWNTVISCFAQLGRSDVAFQLLEKAKIDADNITIVALLKSRTTMESVREIHSYIVDMDFQDDVLVGNTLIDIYTKFGSYADASQVFCMLEDRNMVSWSALITGYAQNDNLYEANLLFEKMQEESIEVNSVVWNALIAGFAESEKCHEALQMYHKMEQQGVKPDHVTFLSVLKACLILGEHKTVNLIYTQICEWESIVHAALTNTLIDVYMKVGSVDDARRVFEMLSTYSVVTWNALIAGYARHGIGHEAFVLFVRMQNMGSGPDKFTYASVLKAVTSVLALDQGKMVHEQIVKNGIEVDIYLWSSLVDMYVKCGSHEDAERLLTGVRGSDAVTWNAMIAGHAQNSDYTLALQCFQRMLLEDYEVDGATYVGLLSACGHGGCLYEGFLHFNAMESYDIDPTIHHYNCLVDILGRNGCLYEAMNLLESLPFEINAGGWTSLLDHCKEHGNLHLAKRCYDFLLSFDPSYSSGYALMSSIHL